MRKTREVIRLVEECGLSKRQVATAVQVSRPMVTKYVDAFKDSGLEYDQIKELSDSNLMELLFGKKESSKKAETLIKLFPVLAKELKKKGVTLQLLWEEYIEQYPDGLRSSQFNYHFNKWSDDEEISMHMDHKAGEKMYIDYTGKKLEITDRVTGEKIPVEVYVAILPASQLTYVEASISQKQVDFMRSTERAIQYFGG
jgi:predicted transcriptional regulator